ncbi:zinc finger MYM-type protein 1-like [Acyrthosiphon pisum]|uniref:TTF-type domain-containing protein n=1 Tax=Acyrthosiphon pisum TaxID=7029 RepID=A0A8R2JMN6_ACYPI|nr:zinc finger MYM-type protein 1-like [Acyrthosiphon pisum]
MSGNAPYLKNPDQSISPVSVRISSDDVQQKNDSDIMSEIALNLKNPDQSISPVSVKVSSDDEQQNNDLDIMSGNAPYLKNPDQSISPVSVRISSDDVQQKNDSDIMSEIALNLKNPEQSISSVSLTDSSDVVQPKTDLDIVFGNTSDMKFENAESKVENICEKVENNQCIMGVGEQDISLVPTTDHTWLDCVGQFSALLCMLSECNNLLTKVTNVSIPNPISFLTESISMISSVKEKSNEFLNMATSVLTSELSLGNNNGNNNIIDKLLDHDPGKREKVQSSSQRNYLLSLGPFQPKLPRYPINVDIPQGRQRQFNSNWFTEYPYLEYSVHNDSIYCFICGLFPTGPNRSCGETSWTKEGVRTWHKMKSKGKNRKGKLELHFTSKSHQFALNDYSNFILHSNHIDGLLNKEHRKKAINFIQQKEFHKDVIKILFDVSRTLARQGLPFRGDRDEKNGNFNQLVLLLSRHCPVMKTWIEEAKFRPYHVNYMSHNSQNEFISLLALETKKQIVNEVNAAKMYSVMADTTPDLSNRDQMSVCVRYVDSSGKVLERLLELLEVTDKTGKGTAQNICEVLTKNCLDLERIAFQSYDYASSMSGKFQGAQAMLSELVGYHIPYIPCQAHRLNTFVEHSCEASIIVCDLFFTLESLYVFFSSSTKRSITLDKALSNIEGSLKLRNLSKTRWTARAESLRAVWLSFEEIVSVLHEISTKSTIDKKTRIQALGLEKKCLSIDFIICMYFMNHIMYQMKILTETLETKDLNIVDALILIDSSIKSLTETRNNSTLINELIASAKSFCLKLDIDFDGDFNQHHRKD